MQLLTIVAKATGQPGDIETITSAMRSATKIWNGLIWQLRDLQAQGKSPRLNLGLLNRLLLACPHRKEIYSKSYQATRDEVIQAYRAYFVRRQNDDSRARPPGFRRKDRLSPLRYYNGYGYWLSADGHTLTLGLGDSRSDGIRRVSLHLQYRKDVHFSEIRNILLTYDNHHGLQAHLVIEAATRPSPGTGRVAVDLGETHLIAAATDTGQAWLYSGREVKAIRRYWKKVRAHVQSPRPGGRKSRRLRQIDRKESRQVRAQLHRITADFVRRCAAEGVGEIAIGDLTLIRRKIDYGPRMNQRLHNWSFGRVTELITYKATLAGIQVRADINEAGSSRRCCACGKLRRANRVSRGQYRCECGWGAQADVNAALNLHQRAYNVSPLRSSGAVTAPVVVAFRVDRKRHTVYAAALASSGRRSGLRRSRLAQITDSIVGGRHDPGPHDGTGLEGV